MCVVWTGFGLETVKRSCKQCWYDVTALYRAVALACRWRGSGAHERVVGFMFIVEGHRVLIIQRNIEQYCVDIMESIQCYSVPYCSDRAYLTALIQRTLLLRYSVPYGSDIAYLTTLIQRNLRL